MAMRLYWVKGGSGLGNPHPNSGTLMPWGRPPQQFCTNRVVTPIVPRMCACCNFVPSMMRSQPKALRVAHRKRVVGVLW